MQIAKRLLNATANDAIQNCDVHNVFNNQNVGDIWTRYIKQAHKKKNIYSKCRFLISGKKT